MEYKLYAGTYCPFCKKVESFLNENNIMDKVEVIYIDKVDGAAQELVKGGGKSQIPCLNHGDAWLYESSDIIDYLEEKLL